MTRLLFTLAFLLLIQFVFAQNNEHNLRVVKNRGLHQIKL